VRVKQNTGYQAPPEAVMKMLKSWWNPTYWGSDNNYGEINTLSWPPFRPFTHLAMTGAQWASISGMLGGPAGAQALFFAGAQHSAFRAAIEQNDPTRTQTAASALKSAQFQGMTLLSMGSTGAIPTFFGMIPLDVAYTVWGFGEYKFLGNQQGPDFGEFPNHEGMTMLADYYNQTRGVLHHPMVSSRGVHILAYVNLTMMLGFCRLHFGR